MASRIRDVFTILRSGLFAHRLYARVYLGGSRAAPFALLHYVLKGEAQDAHPCAFFNPAHLRATAPHKRGNLFAAFLRGGAVLPACAQFDPAWYHARIPTASRLSPWLHFQKFGIPARLDPSPAISLRFIEDAYCDKPAQLPRQLYEILARQGNNPLPPLTLAALERTQARFRAQIELTIHRQLPQRRHRNLVFVQTAGGHPASIEHGRHYDLMLNHYAATTAGRDADYVLTQRGTKVSAINKILQQHPDLLLRYDHVLFLDDDVEMHAPAINELFSIMAREQLDLAQPALTPDSISAFPSLLTQPGGAPIRRFNTVEIMAPALSARALARCGWVFGSGISGYGVDLLLGSEVRAQFGNTVALINNITARHTRPPDKQGGAFYRFMTASSIDPMAEMRVLIKKHGLTHGIRPL